MISGAGRAVHLNTFPAGGRVLYTYDAEHRLLTVAGPSSASYVYDSIGQRVRQTVGSSSKDYVFDQAGRVITQMSPGWARSELYAGGLHVATYTNNTTYFDHSDWLGTVRARSSVSGASVETCTSLPFGDAQTCTGTDWSPLHFTGQDWDSESNLTHSMFRQLSTTEGRWITPDPAGMGAVSPGDPQTWNRYAYVGNMPTVAVDPLGLWRSDAFSSGLDGSCSINGFISACAMVMSFASAGSGGEFGFLCQGNCDAFNSGAIRIGADNVPYAPNNEPISPGGFDELESDLSGGFLLSTGIPGSDGGPTDDRAKCEQAVLNDLNQAGVNVTPSNVATPPGYLGKTSPYNNQGAFFYRGAWNFYIFTPDAVDISPGQRWNSGLHIPRETLIKLSAFTTGQVRVSEK